LSRIRIVDCGDVPFDPLDIRGGVTRTTQAVRPILGRGAVPIVFGGDDAVPIPVVRAYEKHGPIVVIQIDEHMDWMPDRDGVTEGYSSPMRRISEMPWVEQTVQIGLHAFGPAAQYRDARAAGNLLISEQEVHLQGVPAILDKIPAGENYFLTVDMDGFETTFMPAVSHPEPGGLTYREAVDLLRGLAARGRIVGMDWVEFVPGHDLHGLGGHSVGRLIANLLQAMIDAGQFRKR
jgi:agmatinase